MITSNKAVQRALDMAVVLRRKQDKQTATSQDLIDLTSALADAKAVADRNADPGAAFVAACLAASFLKEQ